MARLTNGPAADRDRSLELPALSIVLFALVVQLARGRRRHTPMLAGAALVAVAWPAVPDHRRARAGRRVGARLRARTPGVEDDAGEPATARPDRRRAVVVRAARRS
jgi:hypothetical protein